MKLFITLILLFSSTIINGQEIENAEENQKGVVQLNSTFTYLMLEPNQDLRKIKILMDAKKEGIFNPGNLVIGANMIGIMDYQRSNTVEKFGYLMRHPTGNNQRVKDVSEAVIHSASISFGGAINNWLTVYGELLYDPEQSFGPGTTTALTRNQLQLRKGFIVLGDLNELPLFFALGKMDGNFGLQGSVSPFTNSTMWHAFGTLAYGAQFGFDNGGLSISAMLIQGGAQFRAAHVPVDGTVVPSQLNNFSMDANYTLEIAEQTKLKAGLSFQKGTAYCQPFPVQHFMPCEEANPAMAYYGQFDHKGITVMASFAKTNDVWPGTENPNPPLDVFEAAKVSSLLLGAKYQFSNSGTVDWTVSGEFSNFVAGADNSPWERQNQIVLGVAAQVETSAKLFVEIFRTMGYAPLNWISGGNFDNLGETHSDSDARSTGIVIGGMVTL